MFLLIITFILLALFAYLNVFHLVLLFLVFLIFLLYYNACFFILRAVASHMCWSPVATCLYYVHCIYRKSTIISPLKAAPQNSVSVAPLKAALA